MTDFRAALYEKYVSTFKGEQSGMTSEGLESYFRWCEARLLPMFEGLGPDAEIVEVGCGPGYFLEFLARHGFRRVRGIDISREQIDLAVARGCAAEVADVFDYLGTRRGAIAAIVAIDLVEHFQKDELLRLSAAFHEALAPGGRLIVQTANGEGLFPRQVIYGDLTHATILTPGSFRQLFTLAGFENFRFRESGPVPRGLKGRVRSALWRAIRTAANLVRVIETGKSQAVWTENMICRCDRPTR